MSPTNPASLAKGTDINACDLDYTGDIMPPPGSYVPSLTEDDKLTFARWIDLGCPINLGENGPDREYGWFLDDVRPTLTISNPRPNGQTTPLTEIRIGVADAYKGIRPGSLSIRADFAVNGLAADSELATRGSWVDQGIFAIALSVPIKQLPNGHLTASVYDEQGNRTTAIVRFWIEAPTLRISRLEQSAANRLRLTLEEPQTPAEHMVLASPSINAPLGRWQVLKLVGSEIVSGNGSSLEVELPAGSSSVFLKLQRK